MSELTVTRLLEIMRDCAGEAQGMDPAGEVEDLEFEVLGYDSLALLETANQIEREYGVRLADDQVTEAKTPRAFLALVNDTAT